MATGDLLALIEADYMGQLRPERPPGGHKYLARKMLACRDHLAPGAGEGRSLKRLLPFESGIRPRYGRDAGEARKILRGDVRAAGHSSTPCASAAEAVRAPTSFRRATTASQRCKRRGPVAGVHINALAPTTAQARAGR